MAVASDDEWYQRLSILHTWDRKLCVVIIYDVHVYIMYWAFDKYLKPCCCNGCLHSWMKKSAFIDLLHVLVRWFLMFPRFICCVIVFCCLYMNNYGRGASQSIFGAIFVSWQPVYTCSCRRSSVFGFIVVNMVLKRWNCVINYIIWPGFLQFWHKAFCVCKLVQVIFSGKI